MHTKSSRLYSILTVNARQSGISLTWTAVRSKTDKIFGVVETLFSFLKQINIGNVSLHCIAPAKKPHNLQEVS